MEVGGSEGDTLEDDVLQFPLGSLVIVVYCKLFIESHIEYQGLFLSPLDGNAKNDVLIYSKFHPEIYVYGSGIVSTLQQAPTKV